MVEVVFENFVNYLRSGNTDKLNIISFQQNQQHKINLSTQLIFYRILTKTVVQLTVTLSSVPRFNFKQIYIGSLFGTSQKHLLNNHFYQRNIFQIIFRRQYMIKLQRNSTQQNINSVNQVFAMIKQQITKNSSQCTQTMNYTGIFHSNQSPRREEKIEGPLWCIDLWRGAEPLDVKFHQAPWGLAGGVW
ncbi:Hypothetical_protein [Hexamita inflata]|uniref:Hypothetical_protein n=1 Tax=Hexamita inflata TaxID=28002 RepID=A0AA86PAI7_9EUKA|nr:Hypothetical protein HINF_LOCUS21761 [Hexamita inflata]